MEVRQWRMENKVHLDRIWIGPIDAGVELAHPRLIKKLLNGINLFFACIAENKLMFHRRLHEKRSSQFE